MWPDGVITLADVALLIAMIAACAATLIGVAACMLSGRISRQEEARQSISYRDPGLPLPAKRPKDAA